VLLLHCHHDFPCYPDVNTQAITTVYPAQWTEVSPGAFTYIYTLNSTGSIAMYLTINSTDIGRVNITNILDTLPMFGVLNAPLQLPAGQPLSLQLNSSATDFVNLASNNTGWRLGVTRPDNSTADLGLMADWEVGTGSVYNWNKTWPGSHLTLVSQCLHISHV
jgi:hypothetical protein